MKKKNEMKPFLKGVEATVRINEHGDERLLSHKEAASILNITAGTLYNWCNADPNGTEGIAPRRIKMGCSNKYRLSDLQSFIENRVARDCA